MLKKCFKIHLAHDDATNNDGICNMCVARLRDAADFKEQVLRCQKEFQLRLISGLDVKDEKSPNVKLEVSDADDESGVYFLVSELKEEQSEDEMNVKDDPNLVTMLGLDDTVKRKTNGKKLHLEPNERKGTRNKSKLTYALSQVDKLKRSKPSSARYVSERAKHRANLESILKHSNCTPFANMTLAGVACAYCKQVYRDPQQLRVHCRTEHTGQTLVDSKRVDRSNLSIKMDITDLRCTVCDAAADSIAALKRHLSADHQLKFHPDVKDYILEFKLSGSPVLSCALCSATYETFKTLLQHMNGHYRNFVCDVCDMGFVNQHRLRSHQRTHEVGTFRCRRCDKVFGTRVRRACHEKYTHNSAARYTTGCPQCEQSFTSYYRRNRHMREAHNAAAASYRCNVCDKTFILKSKLTSHIKKVHLMERDHECPVCGRGFFIKQSLDEHMVKHGGERVFECTVCHKAYARKKTLREHMRIHNNDRRFKCALCGLAFVQKCSLKSHMLSNHGVTLGQYEGAAEAAST
ncbi:unnamed protein product, partial [Iphiclides podalirius]